MKPIAARFLRFLLVVFVSGVLVVSIGQRASLRKCRAEVEGLRILAAEVERLQNENQRLEQINLDVEELQRLRQEHSELVRLRGEVSLLRQEKDLVRPNSLDATTAPGHAILITSKEGQRIVGDQLKQFEVEADGAIGATKDSWIGLNSTMGQGFIVTGQVWLGGPSRTLEYPEDTPDGFAIYIREWDGLHRYSVTSRYMQVKRRKWSGGLPEDGILHVIQFTEPPLGTWLPFRLEATQQQILFQIGNQQGRITGPLELDGANKIALVPGSKVKDVSVEILPEIGAESGQ